jgi:hypothetical protein
MDYNPQAARAFYRLVRDFAIGATVTTSNAIYYEIKPDERFDASRVSFRVYGRWDEYLTVMAAAGIDTIGQPMDQQTIVLPSDGLLSSMKRQAGFESIAEYRDSGKPTWVYE